MIPAGDKATKEKREALKDEDGLDNGKSAEIIKKSDNQLLKTEGDLAKKGIDQVKKMTPGADVADKMEKTQKIYEAYKKDGVGGAARELWKAVWPF